MAVDIGLLSQVPHRSDADFGESCQGKDVILIISVTLSTVWNSSKTLFISVAFVNSVCELISIIFCFRLKCSVVDCTIPPTFNVDCCRNLRSYKNVVYQRPTGVSDSLPI